MIPVFFSDAPLLLFPVHVAFLELIIDPACSVIFESEKEEKNVMNRLPRGTKGKFFDGSKIMMTCMQGVSILLIVLGVYFIGLHMNYSEDAVRTMSFITLIVSNLLTIQTNRSWENNIFQILVTPNKSVKWIVSLAIVFLAAVLFIPFLRGLFSFAPLGFVEILVSGAVGCLSIIWFEIYKAVKRKSSRAVSGS